MRNVKVVETLIVSSIILINKIVIVNKLTTRKLRKELISFLKENNAFIPFIINVAKQNNLSITELCSKVIHARNVIGLSFVFRSTNQGSYYWTRLDLKWRKHYRLNLK